MNERKKSEKVKTLIAPIKEPKEVIVQTMIERPQTYRAIQWDGSKVNILVISSKFKSLDHFTATKKGKFAWQIVTTDCGQVAVRPNDYILELTNREFKKEYYLIDPVHIEFYEVIDDDPVEL